MTALIEAVRQSRAIAAAPAFAEWSSGEYFPGPTVETDEEIAAFICQNVSTWFHPSRQLHDGHDAGLGRQDLTSG